MVMASFVQVLNEVTMTQMSIDPSLFGFIDYNHHSVLALPFFVGACKTYNKGASIK